MESLSDEVVGDLVYKYGWCRSETITFFGEERPIKISFASDGNRPLQPLQREAFKRFSRASGRLLNEAETAIHCYYSSMRPQLLLQFTEDVASEILPAIEKMEELRKLVTVEEIHFPESFDGQTRVVGILAACQWDPTLGLAVRLENERIVDVGPQDIVL